MMKNKHINKCLKDQEKILKITKNYYKNQKLVYNKLLKIDKMLINKKIKKSMI